MKVNTRLPAKERKASILTASLRVASRKGWIDLDPAEVAEMAGSSRVRILQLFVSTAAFRQAVMAHAIEQKCLPVIAQGLAVRDRRCVRLPDDLKSRALASLNR